MPARPWPPWPAGRATPATVVAHLDAQPLGTVVDRDHHPPGAGVLERIGQRLLHDPVRRQAQARRHRPDLSLSRPAPPAGQPPGRSRPGPAGRRCRAAGPDPCPPSSVRRTPSSRRSSASACRPVSSTARSGATARRGSVFSSIRAAPACTVITLTLCATTSCSSRAIRARSSATAASAPAARAPAPPRAPPPPPPTGCAAEAQSPPAR